MLFNSTNFLLFISIVFFSYWSIKKTKFQNLFLLIVSYVFYGWWDWRFLFLLLFISLTNYTIGILISKNNNHNRKHWLIAGLIINVGVLAFFKYFNFFVDSFIDLLAIFNYSIPNFSLKIILPIGISFYIFLSISYIVDIYKATTTAHKNIINVLLSLSFFPIILAGPIQRPTSLLPQIIQKRNFSYDHIVDGLRQILWGLIAKVVVADNLAFYVDNIFLNSSIYSGSTILLGTIFFSIQIYADFSGYSNIAIGIAKLFGLNLMKNFNYPYFSRNISEFWKRWHISLTTWFRDYVFLPITYSVSRKIRSDKVMFIDSNIIIYLIGMLITWLLTGLWHGTNYTFIMWGLIHGIFLWIYQIQRKPRKKILRKLGISSHGYIISTVERILTIMIILFAWIFFRSPNLKSALYNINSILTKFNTGIIEYNIPLLILLFLFIIFEWKFKTANFSEWVAQKHPFKRRLIYFLLFLVYFSFARFEDQNFIYFQF